MPESGRGTYEPLAGADVLLYDATGQPIPKRSDLWMAGEAEWRKCAHKVFDDLLDSLSSNKPASAAELEHLLQTMPTVRPATGSVNQQNPKPARLSVDAVDGKLSFKLGTITVGGVGVEVKAGIPSAVLFAALVHHWSNQSGAPNVPSASGFPQSIKIGTYQSSTDLITALNHAGTRISRIAAAMLEKIVVAPRPMEIELVRVKDQDLGGPQWSPWEGIPPCYPRDREVYRPWLNPQDGSDPLAKIYARARELGLDVLPAEAGPQLRLQYHGQPLREHIQVGMKPVMVEVAKILRYHHISPAAPCIFDVSNCPEEELLRFEGGLPSSLHVYLAAPCHSSLLGAYYLPIWEDSEWVFARRKR